MKSPTFMIRILAVLFLATTFCGVSQSGMTYEHFMAMSGEDAVILDTSFDVVVAVVREVSGGGITNGNPPEIQLEVVEVLRGTTSEDRRRAVWTPFPHDVDTSGDDTARRIRDWMDQPLPAPKLGAKFILVGEIAEHGAGAMFRVSSLGRFEFSVDRYRWAWTALERAPMLRAQRAEYRDAWPRGFNKTELRDGARPVDASTALEPGDPILMNWATLWQGRVVEVFSDGRVRVRPEGQDSRSDAMESRDNLLLYPAHLRATERARRTAPPNQR